MSRDRWIVIYESGQHSWPLSYEEAESLYEVFDDAKYLVKVKQQKEPERAGSRQVPIAS